MLSLLQALIEFLAAKNELYLEEMQWWLFQQFNLDISLSAISRRLRLVDFGKKKQELVATETNVSLRAAWVVDISGYRADQFVFVDESGVDQRQGWRRTGWCPRGVKPTPGGGRRQGMRHQILPGLTVKGVLAYSIYEGIIDADCFLLWLKDMLLPMTTPFPGPNSVLVMDNASFQFHNRLEAVCGQRGVKLLYLPPFSPEYNPVEGFYHDLRAHIRKHPRYVENSWETGQDWRDFLVGCVGDVGSNLKQIRGHFRKSMVPGVPDD